MGYKLEFLSKETTRLLGSTKQNIDENKSSSVEVVLMDCNVVNNDYQEDSQKCYSQLHSIDNLGNWSLHVFFIRKPLKKISLKNPKTLRKCWCSFSYNNFSWLYLTVSLAMSNTNNTEFSFVEIWFTDQNNASLETEDNVNITLTAGIR